MKRTEETKKIIKQKAIEREHKKLIAWFMDADTVEQNEND